MAPFSAATLLRLTALIGVANVTAENMLRRQRRSLNGLLEIQPQEVTYKSESEPALPEDNPEFDCDHPIFGHLLCAGLRQLQSMSFPTEEPTESPTEAGVETDAPSPGPTVTDTESPTATPTSVPEPTQAPVGVTDLPTATPVAPTPTFAPTAGCEVADREEALISTLESFVNTSLLEDSTTPQGTAFAWLTSDSATDPCDPLQVTQRFALAVFYESTDGNNWAVNDGWLTSASVCNWFEVECLSDNMTVYQIDLFDNNLSGNLPSELGAISSMGSFNVFNNKLTGTIPDLFSSWSKLVLFDVENNTLTGDPLVLLDKPVDPALGGDVLLPELLFFRVSFNPGLGGTLTPNAATQLSGVQQLWLASCSFSGLLPTELGLFVDLEELFLYENNFTGMIPDVFADTDMIELQLHNNSLEGPIPPSLYSNTNLKKLRLDANFLEGPISSMVGNLTVLEDLRLSFNEFIGTLPSTLAALTNLDTLAVRGNGFTGPIRDTFVQFEGLIRADFSENQFTGPLPSSIFDLPDIRLLYFGDNQLTGPIPDNYANPEFLRDLYLYNNSLTGRVPDIEPTQLQVFTEFRIEYNDITGTMPASICALRGDNRTDELVTLRSDCAGDPPEIVCDCCTACFPVP